MCGSVDVPSSRAGCRCQAGVWSRMLVPVIGSNVHLPCIAMVRMGHGPHTGPWEAPLMNESLVFSSSEHRATKWRGNVHFKGWNVLNRMITRQRKCHGPLLQLKRVLIVGKMLSNPATNPHCHCCRVNAQKYLFLKFLLQFYNSFQCVEL